MNVMVYGGETGKNDWIPERAIGPLDDDLYDAEKEYNDGEIAKILKKPTEQVRNMPTGGKRELLMKHRKEELRKLIQVYYRERGWSPSGIPTSATLKQIGLWDFLTEEARTRIGALAG
jgi:aldehyde:ferredoxin oxidoreductase